MDPPPVRIAVARQGTARRRLTTAQVAAARHERAALGTSYRTLATNLAVSEESIRAAVTGQTFTTLADPPPVAAVPPRRAVGQDVARRIIRLRAQGMTWPDIGARVGVHNSTALRVARRWSSIPEAPSDT
ncbi:helix-turn-helix domain-containing protein [Mangrovactinospora gilvigrisea]|uniref:helix-turn-helix domain-containing protein n=1 Tax=Mangrovactinospora gilvigrisea TaxID=1428644 RepID=UPI003AF34183